MGCNDYYPFPSNPCSSSAFQSASGPYPCRPHFPCVRTNFTTPAANSPVIIEVTDTASLTIGQGILLGSAFYIITDVIDSIRIEAQHNGVGATPGAIIYAVHPAYGCFQYPIIPAGKVSIETVATVAGLNAAADTAIAASVTPITVNKVQYGYTGPTTVDFQAEVQATVASAPVWVAIALPVARKVGQPDAAFSGWLNQGAGPVPVVAKCGVAGYYDYAIIGLGGGTALTNGADRTFVVSGKYEIAV